MNTWTDIKNAFEDAVGDTANNFFSDATQVRWASAALKDLCEEARYVDTASVQNVVANTAIYQIAAGGYDVFRVEYDGEALFPISINELSRQGRDWSTRTGLPRFYYLNFFEGNNSDYLYAGLWETPSSNLTNGVRIWYHSFPAAVSDASPSTEIDVPEWAVGAVLFYMLREAYTADTTMQNADAAAVYDMMYTDIKERLVRRSRSRQRKHWVAGQPATPSLNVLNRLPDRVPAP